MKDYECEKRHTCDVFLKGDGGVLSTQCEVAPTRVGSEMLSSRVLNSFPERRHSQLRGGLKYHMSTSVPLFVAGCRYH